jgi:hypothetical protein
MMASPKPRGRSLPPADKVGTSGGDKEGLGGEKMPPRSPKGKSLKRTPSPSRSSSRQLPTRDARGWCGSRRSREVVVERVIRESGGSSN